ncbi:MAG TPA: sulfotransferase [Solirubrobacteraceae bacterium]|nr:sulfotransferase [Solirubrobacteraceae bacterium]
MRAPDFFIVGQYKSGTTALYEMLRAHPQVFMPDLKEIWFHSPELRTRAIGRASNRRPETLEQYLSLFAAATPQQRIGEATPSYLISHEAARSIAELRPDARIIAILRDPATFLQSFHLQAVQNRIETEKDLRKALALEPARREGKSIPPHAARPLELLYSDHVRYVEQLRRYDAVFPREQMLVLIYEDFRRDNEATMRTLLRFIGVDESQPIPSVEANPTVRVRSPRLHRMLWSVYLGRGRTGSAVQRVVKPLVPKRLRGKALKATQTHLIYGSPRSADAELMLELRRRFKGEVEALSDYLDRDLITLWGYDELG